MQEGRPTVAILTLGCKLNQADSEALARQLAARGCQVTQRPGPADAVIINTCSVTHVADRKARHLARLARRLSPQATVVLTGCYAETGGPNLARLTGADLVVGNAAKTTIAHRLYERWQAPGGRLAGCRPPIGPGDNGIRTRAFIKIQEGCNQVCAFCIVPRSRGREVSVPIGEVVAQVRARQAEGVREVVLTGTQLGNYGRDLGWGARGPQPLLEALLRQTSVPRIRLSSLQAQDISPGLLRLWEDGRLCRHFHLPLQSGSDPVLARMRRRYTVDQYRRAVDMIRRYVPDVAITTDVIVGFPGETEADFEVTYRLCQELGFAAIHAFPYSRRPGTAAALMPDQIPFHHKRQRLQRLLQLAGASGQAFRRRYLGRVMPVLWEEARANNGGAAVWQGLTDNYLRVYTCADGDLRNRLVPARLCGLRDDGLWGEPELFGP